ncbi:hypothetical protein [Nostocoides sp. HKS02]|uniref:hypothetical protein n=1 Tax=Nostocoides sp. HKS02 TaxID=1813880 RepID=UPI0012B4F078|nr:hypothetical protein [Tetrasphaera sp. HKS02]QGN59228.1 hypothetical protein GKE56_16535 [Tetrasphaera sp. HKS02]
MVARLIGILVILWLVVGVVATYQRGYFATDPSNCAKAGTIVATVVAGPLNYLGVNPKISCVIPQPST